MISNKFATRIAAAFMAATFVAAGCSNGSYSGDASLDSKIDSASYAIGYLQGQQMKQNGMSDLDTEIMAKGFQTAFNGDSAQISQQQMPAVLQAYQMEAQQRAQKMQQEEATTNQEEGQAFLEENKDKEGVMVTDSGLQYTVLEEGSGATPGPQDTVTVNYEGTLIDGTVFDSSYERGQPADIPLNRVIPGWTEGIQLMEEGATYRFWIPGDLAYGMNPRPNSPIGPNETLIFKVELIEVK